MLLKNEEYFKIEHRHKLVNLLNHKILYNKKKMFLCNAMEEYVSNIASCIIKKQLQTEFPDIQQYLGEPDEI